MDRTHKIVCVIAQEASYFLCKLQGPELSIQLDANLYIHLRKVAAARSVPQRDTARLRSSSSDIFSDLNFELRRKLLGARAGAERARNGSVGWLRAPAVPTASYLKSQIQARDQVYIYRRQQLETKTFVCVSVR